MSAAPRFWRSPNEARIAQAVASDYPQWDGEGAWHYVERLCVLSGMLKLEDAAVIRPDETLQDLKRGGGLFAEEKPGGVV